MEQRQSKWYFIFFLVMLAFVWVVHFNGLYGQDAYEYLRYTKCLKAFIKTGVNPGDYFWPMLYPISGTLFSFLFPLPFALQLISILALVLSAIYLERILILLSGGEKKSIIVYVFLFFLLSPYMLRGSLVVMTDSLTILGIVAGAYYYEKYKRALTGKYFLCLIFCFTAAVSTRYAAFVVVIPFIIIAAAIFIRNFKVPAFLASVLGAFLLFLPHIIIRKQFLFQFIHHEWFDTWSPLNFFRNYFNTSDGYSSYFWDNIVYAFFNVAHPAFCFAGIIFFLACLRVGYKKWKSPGIAPYMMAILLYALFMAGIPFQDLRYLLLSFPFVLIILYGGYEYVEHLWKNKKAWRYILVMIVIIQLALFCRVFVPFYNDNKVEKYVANKMLNYSNKTLYTFSIDGALKSYGFNGRIINMAEVRIDTMKKIDSNFFVLFNPSQFSETWRNGNPMKNWKFLNKQYSLVKMEDMPNGWELYRNSFPFKK
jgi:hypothetical protein